MSDCTHFEDTVFLDYMANSHVDYANAWEEGANPAPLSQTCRVETPVLPVVVSNVGDLKKAMRSLGSYGFLPTSKTVLIQNWS